MTSNIKYIGLDVHKESSRLRFADHRTGWMISKMALGARPEPRDRP
jgi:hypothetical protein